MGNYNTKCTGLLKVITTFIFSICVILCGTCFNYQNVYAETLKKDQNRATSSIESDYTLTLIERGNIKEHSEWRDIRNKR